MSFDFHMKARMICGAGCVGKNAALITGLGKRCLIVTGRGSARLCGALEAVEDALKTGNVAYDVWDGITPNPSVESCLRAGRRAAETGADFIVGIGGGSALDAAKVTGVIAANPGLDEAGFYSQRWARAPLPVVLLGTTSGTGSEVTSVAVLMDSRGRKHSIHDDRLYGTLSLGDPTFTMSLPRDVTVSTCIDALAHCLESYFCKKADDMSRLFAAEGIRQILDTAGDGDIFRGVLSYEQRERLYAASLLGGLAINSTGTVFPHNVGYLLTEKYGVPHGYASAAFLPELLAHAQDEAPETAARLFARLSCGAEDLLALYARMMPALDVRMTAEEIEAALPRWENNKSVNNTVGDMTTEKIRRILTRKFVAP